MKTIDFSYFIERYNAGEMNDSEKEWFTRELAGNEKLRHEVELRRRTDTILKNQDVIKLRNKLASMEKARENPVKDRRKHINMKYAAIIASLVIIGGIVLFSGRHLSKEQIFEKYYKSYETTTTLRSAINEVNSDYTLALEYYKIHDYRNAAVYFSKVIENEPANMHSTLLYGISSFENSNYPEAKRSFRRVIDDNNNLHMDHAHWYLAMCYIKTDDIDKAIGQLSIIKNKGSVYSKDARKILRKMK